MFNNFSQNVQSVKVWKDKAKLKKNGTWLLQASLKPNKLVAFYRLILFIYLFLTAWCQQHSFKHKYFATPFVIPN